MSSEAITRQPVVWIVNKGGHDYGPADVYGRTVPITTDSINPFNLDRMMVLIKARIVHADPNDFVLISGSPILNGVVLAMWLERFGKVNILQYSKRKFKYERLLLTKEAVIANATSPIQPAG